MITALVSFPVAEWVRIAPMRYFLQAQFLLSREVRAYTRCVSCLLFRHDDSAECDQVVIQTYTETAGFAPSRLNQPLSPENTTPIFRTDRTLSLFPAPARP